MEAKPSRKKWFLSVSVAEELGKIAGCHPRTIQKAALGMPGRQHGGKEAARVVADYFDTNPSERPDGWKRPTHAPLPYQVATQIAGEFGVDTVTVQKIAGGIPAYDAVGARVTAAIHAYFAAHPKDAPSAPRETASEAS